MYHSSLLTAGLAIEVTKHTGRDLVRRGYQKASEWVDRYDKAHPVIEPCAGDFMCLAEKNHKHSCPSSNKYTCKCWVCKGERQPHIEGVM